MKYHGFVTFIGTGIFTQHRLTKISKMWRVFGIFSPLGLYAMPLHLRTEANRLGLKIDTNKIRFSI